ncbi:hypothetical protein K443DRAFT_646701 [Laccaria amethystina LaAM-08-1]|uniref:Uncharacterized protein n=1 Tax=Laccaria amethystina LaAM-08-1 TaxID=1095629 RepID=A0A0C9WIN3_9AGAR|nr:hypothetical protein K443DRAFT_646701 [Laccaria amethystina LaAM-08-1]
MLLPPKSKLKLSPYPIRRALPLVEVIRRDFNDVLLRILTSHRLAYTPYPTFERLLAQTTRIYRTWDDLIKEFTNVAREVSKKRSEKSIQIKVVPTREACEMGEVFEGAEEAACAVTAENAYNDRVSRVENQIIARLRDRLDTACNAM